MTTRTELPTMFKGALCAMLAWLALAPYSSLRAQQASTTPQGQAPVAQERPQSSAKGGITVHGHWIMDVKDADGKIVEHRDFQNSLTPNGSMTLALALTGQLVYSSFAVSAIDATSPQPQIYQLYQSGFANVPSPCPAGGTLNGVTVTCVAGLTATAPDCVIYANPSCTTNAGIVLSGTFTPSSAVVVNEVQTSTEACAAITIAGGSAVLSDATTSTCGSGTGVPSDVSVYSFPFTDTTITPLHVGPGQSLLINVVISFS